MNEVFSKHQMFPPNKYLRNFVIRALLLAVMARDGVRRLKGAEFISTKTFAQASPDSNVWLSKLPRKGTNQSLQAFCDDLGYDGNVELLSMFTCLLLTPALWKNPAWFSERRVVLKRRMVQQFQQIGLFKLPALCVTEEPACKK